MMVPLALVGNAEAVCVTTYEATDTQQAASTEATGNIEAS